jgi:hypothetical protein
MLDTGVWPHVLVKAQVIQTCSSRGSESEMLIYVDGVAAVI